MGRTRNERPVSVTITAGADGRWHGFLNLGESRVHRTAVMCASCKAGTPGRECACARKCEAKIRAVEDALAAGAPTVARDPWADQYFTTWLEGRKGEIEYGTLKSYSTVVRLYVVPHVKGRRLRQFNTIPQIKAVLTTVRGDVSAQAARKTLRVLRVALNHAVRDRLVGRNEATYVPMPTLESAIEEVMPLSLEEAHAVLPVIMGRHDKARWLLGLVHGPRQGECLGLRTHRPEERAPGLRRLSDVDLERGSFTIREKIARQSWEHGCDDPPTCAATRPDKSTPGKLLPNLHKLKPCPPGCKRHSPERGCPPPCPPKCDRHASSCPHRRNGGLVRGKPKSKKGARTQAFEPVVWQAFKDYAEWQKERRRRAGSKWQDTGYFFTDDFGRPIDARRDWGTFQGILAEGGLSPARVHALRHSAATFLLAAGVDKRIVMDLLGWSQDMTPVYQHPTEQMKRDATKAVGTYLWPVLAGAPEPEPEHDGSGSATTVLPSDLDNVIPFRRRAV